MNEPTTNIGWECPRCHTINAPWAAACACSPAYYWRPVYPEYPPVYPMVPNPWSLNPVVTWDTRTTDPT